jgi:hypothetical protein
MSEYKIDEVETKKMYSRNIIEIFGAIIPGIYLLICYIVIVFVPVSFALLQYGNFYKSFNYLSTLLGDVLKNSAILTSISTVAICIIISYILGAIYYRRDVDIPNQYSVFRMLMYDMKFLDLLGSKKAIHFRCVLIKKVNHVLKDEEQKEKKELIINYLRQHYAIDGINGLGIGLPKYYIGNPYIKFPYSNIEDYLKTYKYEYMIKNMTNELHELLNSGANIINIIKTRMACKNFKCFEADKIEAHIRYSSSMWYICRGMSNISFIVLLFYALMYLINLKFGHNLFNKDDDWFIIKGIAAICFSSMSYVCIRNKYLIEKYLHKQRLREIQAVLEMYIYCNEGRGCRD